MAALTDEVLESYRKGAAIVDGASNVLLMQRPDVIKSLTTACKVGMKILEICQMGDRLMLEQLKTHSETEQKGACFQCFHCFLSVAYGFSLMSL